MRTAILSLGLLLGGTAVAAAAQTTNGNLRRAEVIKAVGATAQKPFVRNANNAAAFLGKKLSKNIAMVEHGSKEDRKVSFVSTPLDRSKPVKVLTNREIHKLGFITQAEAKKIAKANGGELGNKSTVELRNGGVSKRGSYFFWQTSPATKKLKFATAYSIRRAVTLTGSGESASALYHYNK